MGYRFSLVSTGGDVLESFETSEANWQTGDTVIAHGNRHYKVLSVIPAELAAEFVDGPVVGLLEVEPLEERPSRR